MDIILIVSVMLMFIICFFIMKKANHFLIGLSSQSTIKEKEHIKNNITIIFGDTDVAYRLIILLKHENIDYVHVNDENQIDMTAKYNHLFAVSDDDYKNIMMCIIGEKNLKIKDKIAVCNCQDNKEVYNHNHISWEFGSYICENTLFQKIFPKTVSLEATK